jgi:hypothetical protein
MKVRKLLAFEVFDVADALPVVTDGPFAETKEMVLARPAERIASRAPCELGERLASGGRTR